MSDAPKVLTDRLEELPQPLFDPEALREYVAVMDPDQAIATLAELISLYLADAPRHRQGVLTAIAQKDADALRRAAHTFKSSSRSIGAIALGNLCETLEDHGRANRLILASLKRTRFEELFEGSLTILNQLHQSLKQATPQTP